MNTWNKGVLFAKLWNNKILKEYIVNIENILYIVS
jgi:hypothetical protein